MTCGKPMEGAAGPVTARKLAVGVAVGERREGFFVTAEGVGHQAVGGADG